MTLRRIMPAALALLLCASAARPAPMGAASGGLLALRGKTFGVLLLGEGGSKPWTTFLAKVAKKLTPEVPVEFAPGLADVPAMQKAVDRLQAVRVKKIVAIPLYESAHSPLMDQTRFLLGIRPDPSPAFFQSQGSRSGYRIVKRVRTQAPVVLAAPPEDHPLVVDMLASRALGLSRDPAHEALVLVGLAPAAPPPPPLARNSAEAADPAEEYRQILAGLAERVRAKGGFAQAAAAVLAPQTRHQSERERAELALRKLVAGLSRSRRVLVVPHAIDGPAASRVIRRALRGVFMRYDENGLLTDERLVRWVDETARRSAALPDMRVYKDDGRPLPEPGSMRSIQKPLLKNR